MNIEEKLKLLPDAPGVYLMKDGEGSILYVGKARSIKRRVRSYFQRKGNLSPRIEALISHTKTIDYIHTPSEAEALIFEASLIKEHQPRYNVAVKDDKSFPFLKVTTNEEFPRIFIARRRKEDGARYYGPYTEAKLLRVALKIMRRLFPLRTCKVFPKSVCLNYHLGQCLGPCVGRIDKATYDEIVNEARLFLEGRRDTLLKELSRKMEEASRQRAFEEAARIRDQIEALTRVAKSPRKTAVADVLYELKALLGLGTIPASIEAIDVSNIFGTEAVGSVISFHNGKPDKDNYRRFKIKDIKGIDDYGMIREVVRRRYKRAVEESRSLPDLVMIDGGKGHLNCAKEELEQLGLRDLPIMGIAKELERIYLPHKDAPLVLSPGSKASLLLQRIRDEAHRFALSYHHCLKEKQTMDSLLDEIPGIGPKRKSDLIKHFGSIEQITKAPLEELMKVKSIDRKTAANIVEYFKLQ